MAQHGPPLQYNLDTDAAVEGRLAAKGLKGAPFQHRDPSHLFGLSGTPDGPEHADIDVQIFHRAVVELYSEWCGPCKSVLPTFRRIRIEKDDEAALVFLTVRPSLLSMHQACATFCTLMRGAAWC